MSGAAEQQVKACTHPKVKGGVRTLLQVIAAHIPEGETTTRPMSLDELAAGAQYDKRTARRNRDLLEANDLIKVHDGGQGRKDARYEMLQLTEGARPLTAAPLPLLGRTKSRRTKDHHTTSDLLSEVQTSDLLSDVVQPKVGSFVRRLVVNLGSFVRCWWLTSDILSDVGSPASIDRARDVHTKNVQNVHTHTAREESPEPGDTPRPPPRLHPWHAWCGGPVHVPKLLHEEFMRKFPRQSGESDATVEAALLGFYARRSAAAIAAHEKLPGDDFMFWRPAYAAEFLTETPSTRAGSIPQDLYDQQAPDRRRQGGR